MTTPTPARSPPIVSETLHARTQFRTAGRLLPAIALAAGLVAFFALGLHNYVSLDTLRDHRMELEAFVTGHLFLAGGLFTLIYAIATAISIPGALFLTIAGGLLFGTVLGTALTVLGATVGATILFITARSTFGGALRGRVGSWAERMAEGFRGNAFNYLLVLRLVPLVPFFVVNLVPAFLGVPLRTYVVATLIGITPGALVYANVGAGFGDILSMEGPFSPSNVLTPKVVAALCGLAALSLLPVAYKQLKGRLGRSS
jgi:uncharacterized membrane protein YdjX (TVP38/TMEM64 family)